MPAPAHPTAHWRFSLHLLLQHCDGALHGSPFLRSEHCGASGCASAGVPELEAPSLADESFGVPDEPPLLVEPLDPLPVSCTEPLLVLEPDVESSTAFGSSRPAMTAHAASVKAAVPSVASRATDRIPEA